MLDTAGKGTGRLTTHLGADQLARFVAACREHRLICGLAGGLEAPDVPRLLALGPDVLGFRGALCSGHGRSGRLDPEAVALIRGLIPPADAAPAVGRRRPGRLVVDRIFVRDYELMLEIGAYSHERGHPQRVNFDIAADIRRTPSRWRRHAACLLL